jgi:hypothetical protein
MEAKSLSMPVAGEVSGKKSEKSGAKWSRIY